MLLTVPDLLTAHTLAEIRLAADGLVWRDGASTAGASARAVKRNEQADLSSSLGRKLQTTLSDAVRAHPVVQSAARPRRYSSPILSRTGQGGGYGAHVDNAFMGAGKARVRTDVSYTVFLTDPDRYEGGELVIDEAGRTETLKPPAGTLVLYPSTRLHAVRPVERGLRLAFVGWIESAVRDAAQREILFDLDNLRAEQPKGDASPAALVLAKTVANLTRMWGEP
ncbi:MAG: Fe2+-dependent dioxygenase [Pseudomonadota bacterium]